MPRPPAISTPLPDFDRAPALMFDFRGMNVVIPPDRQPTGKFPLAVNARAYLREGITPRLPQSGNLIPSPLPSLIHSLRRMDDTTPASIVATPSGPLGCGTGTDFPIAGAVAWSNPGNITAPDAAYASVTLTASIAPVTNNPGAASSDSVSSGSGIQAWVNPVNIIPPSVVPTTVNLFPQIPLSGPGQGQTAYLKATAYGFNIPLTGTILGITATVNCQASGNNVTDASVQLYKADVIGGDNKAVGTGVGTTRGNIVYGGSNDLWGQAWSPADINNGGMGVGVSFINNTFYDSEQPNPPPIGPYRRVISVYSVTITITYTAPVTNLITDQLQATNFGFALPGAPNVYTGILVEIKGFQTGTGTCSAQLLKAGVPIGVLRTGLTLPAANSFIQLGGSNDLWGAAWLNTDFNAANFGVQIQSAVTTGTGTFNVDFVRITIFSYISIGATQGFIYVSGAADKVYVDASQVQSGMSGKRLALVPFRPNTSVAPWMYAGDSAKMIKVRSDGLTYKQGITEPQAVPTLATSGAGPISGQIYYAYKYRSSRTGAVSNPSPTAHSNAFTAASNNILVTCTASTDPQVDLIDVYRFGDVLNYTYVTTIQNSSPSFIDNLSAPQLSASPLMAFDDYEPFPSIDIPRTGTFTVAAGALTGTVNLTQTGGDTFNVRWLGGTVIFISQAGASAAQTLVLFNRPSDPTHAIAQVQPVGTTLAPGIYNFTINQPILAAQPLPALWGPTDNAAFMFACGDPLRPGTLYFTKGNNPDSAPQTNSLEVTSPAEPLVGGTIVGGLSLVMSAERGWLIYPNFAQATASVLGISGSPFTTVPAITDRGLFTKEGICTDGGGTLYFIAKDSIRKSVAAAGSSSLTADDLYNLFPHEGQQQQPYTIGGITISPPDYSQPDGMALRFSQGYVYFDYIGLDGVRHTLLYDTTSEGWCFDQYAAPAAIHADNTGSFISPGPQVPIGPIMGCSDGTIRQLSSSASEPGATMTILTPAFDAGDQRATKHWGDLYFETTTPFGVMGNFGITLYTDRYSVQQLGVLSTTTFPASAGTRVGTVVDMNSGNGVYSRDIGVAITVPVNSVGSILYLWQPSSVPQPETIQQRFSDWYDMGSPGAKFVQGVIIEADTGNVAKLFAVENGDNGAVVQFVELGTGAIFNGRSKRAFSVASPFIAHTVRLVTQDPVPWRVWSLEWIAVPYPELADEWHTEMTSHGLKGFQHLGSIQLTHISTADIALTIFPDQGAGITVIIPNSAGAMVKTLVTLPVLKAKLFSYNFSSSAPYRLWKEDVEVEVGEWGRPGPYQTFRPFGGASKMEALV